MPVRSTFSGNAVLGEIRDSLGAIEASAESQVSRGGDINANLEDIANELKKIRTGHELYTWGGAVDKPREED